MEISNSIKSRQQLFICLALFLLLLIPNSATLIYSTDLRGNSLMSVSFIALSLSIWLFVFFIFGKRIFLVLGFIFLLFSPAEIISLRIYGLPLNQGLMESILHTNYTEAAEQMSAQTGLFLLLIVVLTSYLILAFKLKRIKVENRLKLLIATGFLVLNGILFIKMFSLDTGKTTTVDKMDTAWRNTVNKYRKIYPTDLVLSLSRVLLVERESRTLNKSLNKFSFNAFQNSQSYEKQIIVLVIGETARYHNFHLNGYPKETTPYLDTTANLISFSNVYSCGNLTQISIPQMITRANPEHFDRQYKEKTVLDAFQEAGFYTAWISAQNMSIPIIKRLKTVAEYCYFPTADFDAKGFYDASLLPKIESVISNKQNSRKFLVVHTLGSHFKYGSRYPQNFEKFKPTPATGGVQSLEISPADREKLVNAYDNSILYTDYFLHRLISMLRNTGQACTLIYLSDHGESLYDNGSHLIFHGNEHPDKFEYHIPFMVWYSGKYEKLFPQKIAALKNNCQKAAQSTSTFYTLLDLDNIKYNHSEKEIWKSLCSPDYRPPMQRKLLNSSHEILILK